ncbi:AP-3 complex subunit mu-1-like isoform X2 [Centruroides sculpturatus]|uniref:AP-3 complex subunit mu-1-like isoform X2 n=1 Tax=Centruroides sculpturatus TaxID=218467 RepID=UPI000C6EF549|nr:AP-3 complex subunit mu-1-like isoform X2 [Centruroides sculpturatus]
MHSVSTIRVWNEWNVRIPFCKYTFGSNTKNRFKFKIEKKDLHQRALYHRKNVKCFQWRRAHDDSGKMIHSLFLINKSGDIFMEKHWKSVIHRSVCDYFFDAQRKAATPDDIPPVIATAHHYLISIYRRKIFFVAVTTSEVPPLFVIEFLHRVVDTFEDYFGDQHTEFLIKEHFVVVYELLDEMLDNGFPLATESNILKELIKPPNILRTIANTVTGRSNISTTLPTGQLSNIPWRRTGVKYTNNEAYFDVIEEVDAIIDKSGSIVSAEIQGYIDCCIKLSGMPDLSLSFLNPRLFDDVSFHPCVRFRRWESERILSFVPPDGNFRLMSYHVGSNNMVAIPLYVRHHICFKDVAGGKLEISVGAKQTMGKTVESVVLEIPMPKSVLNVTLTPTQGKYSFDPVSKIMVWEIGRIEMGRMPGIRGTINLQSGLTAPESNPAISLQFMINQLAVSGLKVNRLDMYGEKYKPFKGVKYVTKAGRFQVRT